MARQSALRRNWPVVVLSAVVNLALLMVFEAAQHGLPQWIANPAGLVPPQQQSAAGAGAARKSDLEHTAVAGGKQGLQITVARQGQVARPASGQTEAPAQPVAEATEADPADTTEISFSPAEGPETPEYGASARAPVLRRNPATAGLQIGEFRSISMEGVGEECLGTAYGMLDDAGADRKLMTVLAQSKAITIARICAENGSVVVSCRNRGITISPRPRRPMDGCS